MRVLHVLETSLPHTIGSAIRAKAIVENQQRLGINVTVVTSPFFPSKDDSVRIEEHGGVRYYRTNYIRSPNTAANKLHSYLIRLRMMQRYRRAVSEIVERERIEIIHSHSSYLNAYAAAPAAKKFRLPLLYEVRTLWGESAVVEDGWRPESLRHRMIWRLELGAMRRADVVVPIAKGIRDELLGRGVPAEKLVIVPNGVDTTLFRPMPRNEALARTHGLHNCFVVGFIGSMRRLEGLSTLLEACAIARDRGHEVGIVLVGDGPDRSDLLSRAKELRLTNALFTGKVPHDQAADWYSIVDVMVYPRVRALITERVTPLKPLEAMAMGKVCVGSDVGGLTELIEDKETGMIFRAGDAAHLADTLIQLKEDKALLTRLGEQSLAYVKREREWRVLVERYRSLYDKLLRERNS